MSGAFVSCLLLNLVNYVLLGLNISLLLNCVSDRAYVTILNGFR